MFYFGQRVRAVSTGEELVYIGISPANGQAWIVRQVPSPSSSVFDALTWNAYDLVPVPVIVRQGQRVKVLEVLNSGQPSVPCVGPVDSIRVLHVDTAYSSASVVELLPEPQTFSSEWEELCPMARVVGGKIEHCDKTKGHSDEHGKG